MNIAELEAHLEENKERIMAETIKRVQDKIVENFDYTVKWEIEKQAKEKLGELIAEIVAESITTQKQEIIDAVKVATAGIGKQVSEFMIKTATESLSSYSGKDIMKKLFGIY